MKIVDSLPQKTNKTKQNKNTGGHTHTQFCKHFQGVHRPQNLEIIKLRLNLSQVRADRTALWDRSLRCQGKMTSITEHNRHIMALSFEGGLGYLPTTNGKEKSLEAKLVSLSNTRV